MSTFDARCLELAEHFMDDEGKWTPEYRNKLANELAQLIQTTIEDFLREEEDEG
jgi:hypothetical protein